MCYLLKNIQSVYIIPICVVGIFKPGLSQKTGLKLLQVKYGKCIQLTLEKCLGASQIKIHELSVKHPFAKAPTFANMQCYAIAATCILLA